MLIASWGAAPAKAQPSERFPDHVTVFIDGDRHEAFDLGGFQELLRIDADLVRYAADVALLEESLRQAEIAAASLQVAVDEGIRIQEELQQERDRLQARWAEENRLRLEAENGINSNGFVAWVLAGSFAVVSLVLGGVIAGLSL